MEQEHRHPLALVQVVKAGTADVHPVILEGIQLRVDVEGPSAVVHGVLRAAVLAGIVTQEWCLGSLIQVKPDAGREVGAAGDQVLSPSSSSRSDFFFFIFSMSLSKPSFCRVWMKLLR